MPNIVCPTCFHNFIVAEEQISAVRTCPQCGLSLNCLTNIAPNLKPNEPDVPKNKLIKTKSKELKLSPEIGFGIAAVTLAVLLITLWVVSSTPKSSDYHHNNSESSSTNYAVSPTREERIDAFVNKEVEEHWRPIPGGNTKEEAKRLTSDILKAKNWVELERAMEKNGRADR